MARRSVASRRTNAVSPRLNVIRRSREAFPASKESWSELKKVTWPTRIQVRNLTILVFVSRSWSASTSPWADTIYDTVIRFLAGVNV